MHKCVPSNKETQGDTTPYKVFVGGLGDKIDETTLREALSPFGTVTKVSLIRQPDGQSRGFAFVHFTEAGPVETLIQRQNMNVNGRKVFSGASHPRRRTMMIESLIDTSTTPVPSSLTTEFFCRVC